MRDERKVREKNRVIWELILRKYSCSGDKNKRNGSL